MSLQLSALVAGTKYRGEFEDRLQSIVREITDPKAEPTILFIDELHNLVGAGAAEGKALFAQQGAVKLIIYSREALLRYVEF